MANARDFMKGDFKRTDCKSALSGLKIKKNKEIAIIAIFLFK